MGSFNMGCGLSNLSIDNGDSVGLLLLDRPIDYLAHTRRPRGPGRAFQTYTTDIYQPVLPPVFGIYADYGNIDQIEPSRTTEVLEQLFRRPTAQIIECVTSLRGVYDTHGAIAETYLLPGHRLRDHTADLPAQLLALGFTQGPNTTFFTHGDHGILLHDQNRWSILGPNDTSLLTGSLRQDSTDLLELFGEITGSYPGFDPLDWAGIQQLHNLSAMFFRRDVYEGMSAHVRKPKHLDPWSRKWLANFNADWDTFVADTETSHDIDNLRAMADASTRLWGSYMGRLLRDRTAIPADRQAEVVLQYRDNYEFEHISNLVLITTAVNRMFAPSISGEQYGNPTADRALNRLTRDILKRKRAAWND